MRRAALQFLPFLLHRPPEMSSQGKPCVFFDRDGIANRDPAPKRYVETPEEFHLFPAFLEALRVVSERGYRAIIVTNQKGVGTGVVSADALAGIHDRLLAHVHAAGLRLDDIYVCIATNDDHPDRKPNPGMLLNAARKHGIDLARSWMIGDNESDMTAGRAAGCRTIRVAPADKPTQADHHVFSIDELPAFLTKNL